MHLIHGGGMDNAFGVEVADDAHVVDAFGEIGKEGRDPGAALAVLRELPRRGKNGGTAVSELACDFTEAFGQALAFVLLEGGLGIESVDLAGSPHHEEEND